jgi:tRNA(fMet)-specific endonuclease VapC
MIGEFLLDTNVAIRFLAHDREVMRRFNATNEILLPVFALAELYFGARKSSRVAENCERIRDFATRVPLIAPDAATAYAFGELKNELRLKGRMIPACDLWIASLARQHDLTVVSRDQHFSHIEHLRLDRW